MASLVVNPSVIDVTDVNQNTITVNFSCDKTLTDVKLSMDNGNTYINKNSITQSSAVFDITGKSNGNYTCYLKGYYEDEVIENIYGNIIVSNSSLNANEGGSVTFSVKLDKAPTNNQTVTLSVNNNDISLSKSSLTFTPSNYSTVQTVTINVAEDSDTTNDYAIITASSPNVNSQSININVTDNDSPESYYMTVNPISYNTSNDIVNVTYTTNADLTSLEMQLNDGQYINQATSFTSSNAQFNVSNVPEGSHNFKLKGTIASSSSDYGNIVISKVSTTITEGQSDTFTVKLSKAPSSNQVVTLSSNNSDVTLSPTSLTFTPSNYNETQTVTIRASESSAATNYNATITLSSPNVSNQSISVTVEPSTGEILVNPTTYTVTNDILTVYYTLPCEISELYMAVDSSSYSYRADSFTTTSATFNMSSITTGIHNISLRGTVKSSSGYTGDIPSPSDSLVITTDFDMNTSSLMRYENCSNGYTGMTMPSRSYAVIDKYISVDKFKMSCDVEILDEWAIFGLITEPIINGVPISSAQKGAVYLFDSGKIRLYDHYKGYLSLPTTVRAETPFSVEVGKKYRMTVNKRGWIHRLTMTEIGNESNTATVEYTNDGKDSSTQYCGKGWGLPGVCCFSGSVKMTRFEWDMCCSKTPKAIIFGDSITEGTNLGGGTGTDDKWSSQVRDKYYDGNALICGRGWATTNDVKQRMDALLDLGVKPTEDVVILVGTNDVRANDSSLEGWKVDITSKILPTITDIRYFNANPVICCLPLCQTDINNRVRKANQWILEQGWTSPRFDVATSTGDGTTYDSSCLTDGLHPNKKGSDQMYNEFVKAMQNK